MFGWIESRRYNVDVHIVNDFTFLFDGEEYQGGWVDSR